MNEGRTVFAQLMDQLPKYELDKCIARYGGNRRMRSFSTYEQFLTMAFAQLTYRESLRDIATYCEFARLVPLITYILSLVSGLDFRGNGFTTIK